MLLVEIRIAVQLRLLVHLVNLLGHLEDEVEQVGPRPLLMLGHLCSRLEHGRVAVMQIIEGVLEAAVGHVGHLVSPCATQIMSLTQLRN